MPDTVKHTLFILYLILIILLLFLLCQAPKVEHRCQICGRLIGEEYGSHVVEAHHIEYFVKSLNNDASNQIIVCPNHHSIIHDVDPVFDRKRLLYIYPNGFEEKFVLNMHL